MLMSMTSHPLRRFSYVSLLIRAKRYGGSCSMRDAAWICNAIPRPFSYLTAVNFDSTPPRSLPTTTAIVYRWTLLCGSLGQRSYKKSGFKALNYYHSCWCFCGCQQPKKPYKGREIISPTARQKTLATPCGTSLLLPDSQHGALIVRWFLAAWLLRAASCWLQECLISVTGLCPQENYQSRRILWGGWNISPFQFVVFSRICLDVTLHEPHRTSPPPVLYTLRTGGS